MSKRESMYTCADVIFVSTLNGFPCKYKHKSHSNLMYITAYVCSNKKTATVDVIIHITTSEKMMQHKKQFHIISIFVFALKVRSNLCSFCSIYFIFIMRYIFTCVGIIYVHSMRKKDCFWVYMHTLHQ